MLNQTYYRPFSYEFSYRVGNKRHKTKKWKNIYQKFNDAENINYFLTILKDKGIPICAGTFPGKDIEPAFAGPFVVALLTFHEDLLGRIAPDREKLSIRSPKFHLYVVTRKTIIQCFFLRKSPSERLESMMEQFADNTELYIEKELDTFDGNLEPYASIVEDAFTFFENYLVGPTKAAPLKANEVKSLSKLEKSIYEAASWLTKKNGFFNPPSLIKSASSGRGIKKERIAAIIQKLFSKNLFIPISSDQYQKLQDQSNSPKMFRIRNVNGTFSAALIIKKIIAGCIRMVNHNVDYFEYMDRLQSALTSTTQNIPIVTDRVYAKKFFKETINSIKILLFELKEMGDSQEKKEAINQLGLILCGYLLMYC